MTTATATNAPQAGAVEELKARKVELVLQQLDALPTLPAIALQLLALTGDSESKIEEVTRLVSSDPALTGKVLSLANSAASGAMRPKSAGNSGGGGGITNLQQAVLLLGWDALRNLALSIKVFEIFQAAERPSTTKSVPTLEGAFSISELWKHSLAVATMAELLAPKCTPRQNPSEAFVCGLLHDLGKIAFDAAMPKSFARVVEAAALSRGDIADIERRVIGLDHALAGKRVAESWNLPPVITESIWLHGAPPLPPAAPSTPAGISRPHMVTLIGLADLLVRRQHLGFSGNYLFPYETDSYTAPLALSPDHLATATAALHPALEARSRAIGMGDVESRALYLESIANANLELGRANQLMATQNRKLATRSMCFELMTAFYSRVSPAASPAQLLGDIAHASHAFFNSSRLVLFSQDPAAASDPADPESASPGLGEILFYEAGHGAQDSFLMPMPRWAGDQRIATSGAAGRPGQAFARSASPQLDWILDKAQTFLGTRDAWFIPLLAGAEPVGGILWIKQPATDGGNSMQQIPDLSLVAQAWGSSLRTAQIRERQSLLAETLAAANRELGALQQQLVRARSLASVGEMAAGAAHEMNNPLAIICGRAQLLAAKLSDAPLKSDASLIATQGERLSGIITDMMEFARPPVPRPTTVTASEIANAAAAWAADRFGAAPDTIDLDLAPNLPPLLVDAKQIKQALGEILLNSLQATRAVEGRTTSPVRLEARYDTMNRQLLFRTIDTGIGMTPDVLKHAFSPFYSAKSAGRNRGMGLAKALRWVENHAGAIRLDSKPNTGTLTILLLPTSRE